MLKNADRSEEPVAKLMFLAAFAPYSVTEKDIAEFRQVKQTDKELVEVCFWAVQTLTNRIEGWLTQPFSKME